MDILSAINEYINFVNIMSDSPKEFMGNSFSERARTIGGTGYRTKIGQVSNTTINEAVHPVFA